MIHPRRSKKHLAFVRGQRCAFCARPAAEAHHVGRLAGGGGVGIKGCDLLTAPLCREHHRAIHQHGTADAGPFGLSPGETQAELWKSIALCLRERLLQEEEP